MVSASRFATVIVVALLAQGCGAKPAQVETKRGASRYPVEVAAVEARVLARTVTATGALAAFENVRISARVTGVVDRLLVAEGDRVEAGQVVAEIEAERFRIALAVAEAQLARAVAAHADATRTLARREELFTAQVVSEDEVGRERLQAALAGADRAAAEAAVAKARLDLRDAQVTAPIAGTVQARMVETGAAVMPGTGLAVLVRRDPLLVRFSVPVEDAAGLAAGMPCTVRVRGGRDAAPAVIVLVAEAADAGSRQVPVTAKVEDPGRTLRPGAFCTVEVPVSSPAPVVVIPDLAIRASAQGFIVHVVVEGKDGPVAQARTLRLGGRDGNGQVEVLAGLTVGDRLIVRGAEAIRDGVGLTLGDGPRPAAAPATKGE
jgi:multidrug efflux system membrane fusion protein